MRSENCGWSSALLECQYRRTNAENEQIQSREKLITIKREILQQYLEPPNNQNSPPKRRVSTPGLEMA